LKERNKNGKDKIR